MAVPAPATPSEPRSFPAGVSPLPRLGPAAARGGGRASKAAEARVVRCARRPDGYFSGAVRGRAGGRALPLPARRRRRASPTPPRASSPRGRTARRRSSIPRAFRWTRRGLAGRRACAGRSSTRCTSARSRREGTWDAARARAARARATLGVTVLEVMPVADFPGRFGWGYDGVNLFAPTRLYGTPDDLRALRRRGAPRSASA